MVVRDLDIKQRRPIVATGTRASNAHEANSDDGWRTKSVKQKQKKDEAKEISTNDETGENGVDGDEDAANSWIPEGLKHIPSLSENRHT